MMSVDENLVCGFKILQPRNKGINIYPKEIMRSLTPPKKRNKKDVDDDERDGV
jgi:hypothetical protein